MQDVEIIQPKEQRILLLHHLTYPEVLAAKKGVSNLRGELVGGPDRRGANAIHPAKLWLNWQSDVVAAGRRLDAVPQHVMDFFQATKDRSTPPRDDEEITITHPGREMRVSREATGAPMLDLGMDLNAIGATPIAPAANPCQGKLLKPPHFATSFSGMEEFLQCPYKWAAAKYYKTVPYEESESAAWGNRVHKAAEDYMLNALDRRAGKPGARTIDEEALAPVKRYCDFFIASGAELLVEKEICCTKALKTCGWKDWNTVWFRFKGDLFAIKDRKLTYIDWKSGKRKDDVFQIEVAAVLADLYFGEKFDTFDGKMVFVKETDPKKAVVGLAKPLTKADLPSIWERIFAVTNRMEQSWETANFRMQKNGLCQKYCGNLHCIHNGRR